MKHIKSMIVFFSLALLALAAAPKAGASAMSQTTYVSFNRPVEIPGTVLLPGTYVFRLAMPTSDMHVIQVFKKNDRQLVATLFTIPDFKAKPANNVIVMFKENPAAAVAPAPIKEWLYPGNKTAQEFVYPRKRAIQIARATNEDVPAATETALRSGALHMSDVSMVTPQS